MADDDWDDWGDDDNDNRGPDANPHLEANVEATQSEQEEEEEGWSWPADNTCNVNGSIEMFGRCSAASMADVPTPGQSSRTHATHTRRRQQVETLKEREAEAAFARQVDVVADKFFVELKGYLEDLADPSVREGINHVRRQAGKRAARRADGRITLTASRALYCRSVYRSCETEVEFY